MAEYFKREPPVPTGLPKPDMRTAQLREAEKPREVTPLAVYLRLNSLPLSTFCRALGQPFHVIRALAGGTHPPNLSLAYEIERLTKGVIPMESWLGTAVVKAQLARTRKSQPPESRSLVSKLDAGGFAKMERRKRGRPRHDEVTDDAKLQQVHDEG